MNVSELYELYRAKPVVCTDTRNITEGCIFFALKGPSFNANEFANEALQKGAAYAIVDDRTYAVSDRCILVENALTALQELATYHRAQMKIPVIAIAGSNGKTTTKELLSSVLSRQFTILYTPGNFNNHIGLPLTLLMLTPKHEMAVIEMGANHIGENAFLCGIAAPDYGVITNNGKDHLEGFGSMEGVATSNSELYAYLKKHGGTAFVNANDEWLMRMASRLDRKVTYAANDGTKNAEADHTGTALSLRPEIVFTLNNDDTPITSPLSGEYNFDNIMAAVAIGRHMGVSTANIRAGIGSYRPGNNRSQVMKKERNTIYMDAYNANPSSMEASLRNFAAMPFDGKTVIIGDMFELGRYAAEEHAGIIELCGKLGLQDVILIGEEFVKQNKSSRYKSFGTTSEAIEWIRSQNLEGRNIFMKGSRGMRLETIAEVVD